MNICYLSQGLWNSPVYNGSVKMLGKKMTYVIIRVFFIRKCTSWIWVFLALKPRQNGSMIWEKIRKSLLLRLF